MRFRCVCAYDGTDFCGWQKQPDGTAVQDVIEGALSIVFGTKVLIYGSGRTDAGVHAKGQVFHWDADWKHDVKNMKMALVTKLPQSIQILSVESVDTDFHARFSAVGKRYTYHIHEGFASPFDTRFTHSIGIRKDKLDLDKMNEAAQILQGEHDFTAFSAKSDAKIEGYENPVKKLYEIKIRRVGRKITFTFYGSGFLYKMVRSLSGVLLSVGQGKITPSEVSEILLSKTRTPKVKTAPAKGLCLDKVYF
jgi:tRNA pseudouridine38-40 synthase